MYLQPERFQVGSDFNAISLWLYLRIAASICVRIYIRFTELNLRANSIERPVKYALMSLPT